MSINAIAQGCAHQSRSKKLLLKSAVSYPRFPEQVASVDSSYLHIKPSPSCLLIGTKRKCGKARDISLLG